MSAAAEARGGAITAEQGAPLDAMEGNPAGLAGLHARVVDLGAIGVIASGSFANKVDPNGRLHGASGALPYGAYATPLGAADRWSVAFAVTPASLSRVDWRYLDPPGTAGATYGYQNDESKIVAIRSAAGVAVALTPHWSLGATFGLTYNTNTLEAPYIFQQQPQLAGLKVLLDLNTRGFGWDGSAGAQWQLARRLRVGAAWKSGTYVQSHGDASGTASAQFAALGIAADPVFHYQAEVDNHLPQSAAVGAAWDFRPGTRLALDGNWVDWGGAFRSLPVKLKDGTNATINSVAGSSSLFDGVPLHWRDQGAVHFGFEKAVSERWTARAGYGYMSDPVPSSTLTPVTAAILRNSLAAGAGWARERWTYDAAYRIELPASQSVGHSGLLAGEYDDSHVRVLEQELTLTARRSF